MGLAAHWEVKEVPTARYFYDPHPPPVLRFDETGEEDGLAELLEVAKKVLGQSEYRARAGVCTWLNAVYWLDVLVNGQMVWWLSATSPKEPSAGQRVFRRLSNAISCIRSCAGVMSGVGALRLRPACW